VAPPDHHMTIEDGCVRICRAGHAYLADSLHEEQSETEEDMLWEAYRALEEGSALARRIAGSECERNRAEAAMRFEESAQKKEQRAMVIQRMLLKDELSS
jgi:hypothetical protein